MPNLKLKGINMPTLLHRFVKWIARLHDFILTLNDTFEYNLTDKQLHFLCIGLLGVLLLLLVYPLFKLLNRKNRILEIAWIYVFTVLVAISFAIEIGQRLSGSGSMDFDDIVAGMLGFFAITGVLVAVRLLLFIIRRTVRAVRRSRRTGP